MFDCAGYYYIIVGITESEPANFKNQKGNIMRLPVKDQATAYFIETVHGVIVDVCRHEKTAIQTAKYRGPHPRNGTLLCRVYYHNRKGVKQYIVELA